MDLLIGYLHAYPNGELQFENYDEDPSKSERYSKRLVKRVVQESDQQIAEANLEQLARAMSSGLSSVNVRSCF